MSQQGRTRRAEADQPSSQTYYQIQANPLCAEAKPPEAAAAAEQDSAMARWQQQMLEDASHLLLIP